METEGTMNWTRGLMTCLAAAMMVMPVAAAELTLAEREQFLKTAEIVKQKSAGMGVTGSSKATLQTSDLTHAAHVQTIDETKAKFESTRGLEMNFRDSYKFNIAAYEVAKLLDLNMVPPSVSRTVKGTRAAVTWWVDDVAMTELDRYRKHVTPPSPADWNRQMDIVRVFDQLIMNVDRNLGNLVITNDWQIHMIDHTRAFRLMKQCPKLKEIARIERNLLARLRTLDYATLKERAGAYLTDPEIKSVLARRDAIVSEFESRIERLGEAAVVFEMTSKSLSAASPENRSLSANLNLQASN
jgi:hypothetical protein